MAEPTNDEDLLWSDDLLRSFRRSAFRLETRAVYALTYERADFEQFVAGTPVPPPQLEWWRPWLEEIARLTAEGKTVGRVRVTDEPLTDYPPVGIVGRTLALAGGRADRLHAPR